MWRDALLVAAKDLRIERRARVTTYQVLPFAVLVLVLFAFALDPDRGVLADAAPGLFWVAVLFTCVMAVQRSFAIEEHDRGLDGLRLAGLDGAGVFLGKAGAVAVELVALQVVLGVGVMALYSSNSEKGVHPSGGGMAVFVVIAVLATVGLASAGTCYGVLAVGARGRESLLPLLFLPAAAPVLLCSTRASEAALGVTPGLGVGDAYPWMRLLGVFAVVYAAAGVLVFGSLLEDA